MLKREFISNPVWIDIKQFLNDRLQGLIFSLIDKEDPETRGAIKELQAFVESYPETFPDEMPDGKPAADPVNEALDGKS